MDGNVSALPHSTILAMLQARITQHLDAYKLTAGRIKSHESPGA